MSKKPRAVPRVRCAIYTRKSTDENLDSEFNTLDAQRESAEAYIASQREEGWTVLPERYDDGGYSGGNLERLALQRLLADVDFPRHHAPKARVWQRFTVLGFMIWTSSSQPFRNFESTNQRIRKAGLN